MPSKSFMKSPWTPALLLLVLIWTVFLVRHNGTAAEAELDPQWASDIAIDESVQLAPAATLIPSADVAVSPPPSAAVVPHVKTEQEEQEEHEEQEEQDEYSKAQSKTLQEAEAEANAVIAKFKADADRYMPYNSSLSTIDNYKSSTAAPASKINRDRPLVLVAYSQTDIAQANLAFFLKHGLNQRADFIFIINGESPEAHQMIPKETNIKIVQRPNDCYDLGAYSEVLTKDHLWKSYKKFILMNTSLRGPFMPSWADGCWMDMYLGKVTDEVKLVGMTGNCWPSWHVQSMIWATDSIGLQALLYPPKNHPLLPPGVNGTAEVGINGCFHTWDQAVHAEIFATKVIKAAGYKATVLMSAYYSDPNYEDNCDSGGNGDVLWNGRYFGTNIHPYETIFIKANRDIDPVLLDRLTKWQDASGYSSYDHCLV